MEQLKVLLVDDEAEFIKALAERLELRGMAVRLAFDGEQALRSLDDGEPEVMVLDLKMPGVDGMEVLRRVSKNHPGVRVIMLTGHGSEKDREQALRLGASAYLQKPVQLDELVQAMRQAGAGARQGPRER
jgi:two-component system, OmpR family, response regulator CpxR